MQSSPFRPLNVLLALVIAIAIPLVCFEFGLRLIGFAPPASILEFDGHTGWRKKPNVKVHRSGSEYSVTIATNELGLADDSMPSAGKPAGTFRVLVLGDSFTQGFTVDRKDLFVDLLEQRWRTEGRKVEVINAGTEGWSTDQEVAWLMQHGAEFQPDLVLLAAYENDIYWNGQSRYLDRNSAKPAFKIDGTLESGVLEDVGPRPCSENLAIKRFAKTIPIIGAFFAPPNLRDHIFKAPGAKRFQLKEFAALLNTPPDFFQRSLDGTEGALRAFKTWCDDPAHKAEPLLITLPSHSAVDANFKGMRKGQLSDWPQDIWSPDAPVATFRRLADKVGVRWLDPTAALRTGTSSEQSMFFTKDWHLNPNGNRVLANYLHDELDARNALTDANRAGAASAPYEMLPRKAARWPYVFALLWVVLSSIFLATYADDRNWKAPLKVGAMLAAVFVIVLGGGRLLDTVPQQYSRMLVPLFILIVVGFVLYKLGRRLATIAELLRSFVLRGHWYLMPLLVVLLSIGSLLVVAASSPLIAPFIYTLF